MKTFLSRCVMDTVYSARNNACGPFFLLDSLQVTVQLMIFITVNFLKRTGGLGDMNIKMARTGFFKKVQNDPGTQP